MRPIHACGEPVPRSDRRKRRTLHFCELATGNRLSRRQCIAERGEISFGERVRVWRSGEQREERLHDRGVARQSIGARPFDRRSTRLERDFEGRCVLAQPTLRNATP
jgi:hypothetical protein